MTATTTTTFTGRDGLRLAADVAGDPADPAVLLFHGGGQTRHSWGTTQRDLASRGWYVATVDLRGHGDSEWAPDGDYRIEAFAADVATVARTFDRPALVGASLGGTSSLFALGAEGEDLARALVLVDVAPNIQREGVARIGQFMTEHLQSGFATLDEVADAIQAYNPHRPRPSNLDGLRKNVRRRDDGRWYWHWDPAFASGRQSDLLSEEGAARFRALVPHARFVDVAGAGHMVAGDRNDAFDDTMSRSSLTSASSRPPAARTYSDVVVPVEWPGALPRGTTVFAVCGVSAVIAGGLVAAVTGPIGWERGSWVAAFLVLVAGVSQIGLAFGRVVVANGPDNVVGGRLRVAGEAVVWNVGSLLVILGGALSWPVLATAGGALLAVGLWSFAGAVRSPAARGAGRRRAAYVALIALLAVSVPTGVALSWLRA